MYFEISIQKALKALKERLKKPDDEDVTTQWGVMDRNTTESSTLIQQTETNSNNEINSNLIENISDNNDSTDTKKSEAN